MRRDALRAACLASIVLASSGLGAQTKQSGQNTMTKRVQDSGVSFEWLTTATQLQGCMQAQTTGWITVGFNTRPTLDGARLVMGRVDAKANTKSGLIEIHQAMPPRHEMRHSSAASSDVIELTSSVQRDGVTRICFRMALAASYAGDVALVAGKPVHLILAWSHERDFQHHSAQRGAVNTVL
jgi:hypothetical protein